MAQLAIKGHPTRGKEVIQLLEMLGGKNVFNLYGTETNSLYYIFEDNNKIYHCLNTSDENVIIYTFEEFLEKFPYKVGDKVRAARINDIIGEITNARWDNYEEQIIYEVEWDDIAKSTLTYFVRGLQPYKEETMETITIDDFKANTKEWLIDKLESMSKDNALQAICNIHDELHKPKYPKTYVECCEILDVLGNINIEGYKKELLLSLQKLLICRDAYWKIAGDQMGLDKPWESNPSNEEQHRYAIYNYEGTIAKNDFWQTGVNAILAFPTEEMRDAFYENFKDLIEQCKELL